MMRAILVMQTISDCAKLDFNDENFLGFSNATDKDYMFPVSFPGPGNIHQHNILFPVRNLIPVDR